MKLKYIPSLDKEFAPLSVLVREMRAKTQKKGTDVSIAVERTNGAVSVYRTRILPENRRNEQKNRDFVERLTKALLWVSGGFKITVSGSRSVGEYIKSCYTRSGLRAFDVDFFETVYERPFEVVVTDLKDAPSEKSGAADVGKNFDGMRIGFDAGGSDRKVSAVIDGEAVYSEEVIWHPKVTADPDYHFNGIYDAFKTAASKMPRVDAIGVSTAGVLIDNRPMVSSLFLKVPQELKKEKVQPIYLNAAKKLGEELGYEIPIEVANDGDVTALAGAINLDDNAILGIAMGTSEAGGYVDRDGRVTGKINELAFVPVDANPGAAVDEWSGDYGCGVKYFSQDSVIKLGNAAGVDFSGAETPAEKLKIVQALMDNNDPRAEEIFRDIGIYFGYAIPFYCEFYDISHVLIMGRVTSGRGGELLLETAGKVLKDEFPEIASKVKLHIPDEKSRRVGQSVAAASLPKIGPRA